MESIINRMENEISDILRNLSVDFEQIDNASMNHWKKGEFYLEYINYKGREIRMEDVKDMIMDVIKKYKGEK